MELPPDITIEGEGSSGESFSEGAAGERFNKNSIGNFLTFGISYLALKYQDWVWLIRLDPERKNAYDSDDTTAQMIPQPIFKPQYN